MKLIKGYKEEEEILGVDIDILKQFTSDNRLSLEDKGVYMTILQCIKKNKRVTRTDLYLSTPDPREVVDASLNHLLELNYIEIDGKEIKDIKNEN